MKIEIGKRYRTRDGRIATIESKASSAGWFYGTIKDAFPFVGKIDDETQERCYTANGYWGGESYPCGADLIELIESRVAVESRFTVESLSNDGFSVRIQHGTPKAKFNVELQKHGAGATACGDNLDTALAEAHTLWESAASRDYVVKLYIFQGGIVRTTTPGGEKPIASKIVRFNAKSGDFE